MNDIQSAVNYFIVLLIGGIGVFVYQYLRDASNARKLGFSVGQENLNNMAAIRETLKDALKRNTELEKELKSSREQIDLLQETIMRLSRENANLQLKLKEALKVIENK